QNAFVMGETLSTNFPTTPDAFDTTCGTDGACNPVFSPNSNKFEPVSDIFVMKWDTKCFVPMSLIYSTFLGGSGEERIIYKGGIVVDPAGELIYVTGMTSSVNPADFPIRNADQPLPTCTSSDCFSEAFITKLDISLPLNPGLIR